jgi:hypothetical protein
MHASRRHLAITLLALFAATFASIGCKHDERKSSSAASSSFVTLGPSSSAVREAFDRDVGTARVVMLVSPT